MHYFGSCHCERIRFRFESDPIREATLCNCSICAMKAFVHHIVPRHAFHLLCGADDLTSYRFGTQVANHTFCRCCGVHPFYTPRSDPDKIDINLRCVADLDLEDVALRNFDGQNWEEAILKAHWRAHE